MEKNKDVQSKYQFKMTHLYLWLVIWYIMVSLFLFISNLSSTPFKSLEDSIIIEGDRIVLNGIFKIILLSILWPLIFGTIFTVGWLLLGIDLSTLIQTLLGLLLLGFISSIITLVVVITRKKRTNRIGETSQNRAI